MAFNESTAEYLQRLFPDLRPDFGGETAAWLAIAFDGCTGAATIVGFERSDEPISREEISPVPGHRTAEAIRKQTRSVLAFTKEFRERHRLFEAYVSVLLGPIDGFRLRESQAQTLALWAHPYWSKTSLSLIAWREALEQEQINSDDTYMVGRHHDDLVIEQALRGRQKGLLEL